MTRSSRILAGAAVAAVLGTAGNAYAFTVPSFTGTDPTIGAPGYPDFWAANNRTSLTQNNNGTFTLSIVGSFSSCGSQKTYASCSAAIFNFPSAAYLVGNEQISITAQFDSTGHLLTGAGYNDTYTISGTLPPSSSPSFKGETPPPGVSWGAVPYQTLFSTSLTAATVDSTHEALGFKSTNFGGWANQHQFTGGQTTESVWLYQLLNNQSNNYNNNSNMFDTTNCAGTSTGCSSSWNNFLAELKSHSSKTPLMAASFNGIASLATVPLPAAVWLFGSGLVGLGGLLRRRRVGAGVCRTAEV